LVLLPVVLLFFLGKNENPYGKLENHTLILIVAMPNITLIRDHLFKAIGKEYTDQQFDELCFEFGVEVDDVATEIIEVLQLFFYVTN
jgi:hypothetical protein